MMSSTRFPDHDGGPGGAAAPDRCAGGASPRSARPTAGALVGRTVLLPRWRDPDALAQELVRGGAHVLRAALTRTVVGPRQEQDLARLSGDLAAARAAWLVLTSARTVEVLTPHLRRALPCPAQEGQGWAAARRVRVAVVGPATARAWESTTGLSPDLVARGSAMALLELPELAAGPCPTAPDGQGAPAGAPGPPACSTHRPDDHVPELHPGRRLLLPASALADPALAEGLRRAGWEVEQVEAYTTVTLDPGQVPEGLRRAWHRRGAEDRDGGSDSGVDAVVLTAPSTARAMVELLGRPPQSMRLVAIGATTARATRGLGLGVAAVAGAPTPQGVREAVEEALRDP